MAIVTGAYLSIQGSGQVGDLIQVRRNRHGSHAFRPRPRARQNQGAPTPAQRAVRTLYAVASAERAALDPSELAALRTTAAAADRQQSAWNVYLAARTTGRGAIDGGAPEQAAPAPATLDGRGPADSGIWLIEGGAP